MTYPNRFFQLAFFYLILLLMLSACRDNDAAPTSPAVPVDETAATQPATEAPPTQVPAVEAEPAATAVDPPTADPPVAREEPIFLSIIWHQHQPVYYLDPETNVFVRPWVRVHATKDYVDMAAILEQYPDIRATFNLTPSLIRQLDALAAGAKDLYWVYAEIPAANLDDEQKQFILERFFDTNRTIVNRFPRYAELLRQRDAAGDPINAFSTQDFLDLQILFNLAWVDPDWLAQEPLDALVAKGSDFDEADKEILFAEHLRLIEEVIPIHRRLQDAGQIEITMTPFAHPILPLLVSTDLARTALPDATLPSPPFVYGQDAVAQVELGVQLYEEHFGRPPRGMWPAEGSVAQEIVTMVAQNGIQWMASDEGVLANSLGLGSFTRNAAEVVVEADQLYRPYDVQGGRGGPVAIVFRDVVISDKVGFTYSGLPGELAAADFINRIHAIRDELIAAGAEGPYLVSVILDGENAWEHYENDGKEFLHSLYQRLSDDPAIVTVTPSEFIEVNPEREQIEQLWPGSWISHDFSTWIGEEEENKGWELLKETRDFLQRYITGQRQGSVSEETLDEAMTLMYIAEGSDWFWWYGADQNSGNDESFDQQFRDTLKQIYLTLGEEPPGHLDVPIIPQQPATADRPSTDLIAPIINGIDDAGEWDAAGLYEASGGVMATAQPFFRDLAYGFDSQNLYLRLAGTADFTPLAGDSAIELYLNVPGGGAAASFSRAGTLLGFGANRLLEIQFGEGQLVGATFYRAADGGTWTDGLPAEQLEPGLLTLNYDPADEATEMSRPLAAGDGLLEIAIPLAALGNADTGSLINLRAFYRETVVIEGESSPVDMDRIPGGGPAVVAVPDLGTTEIILDITDPEGDDHGPGSYTYPGDAVFSNGNFDILNFQVGEEEENIVFRFTMRGPVDNPWGSPNGLSVQTFDIYIDQDGDGQGGIAMLPGRNVAFQDGYAWDYAITVEGWESGIYTPSEQGPQQVAAGSQFLVLTDPGQRKVTIRVPKAILGDTPEAWRYAAVVLGQEGFPSSGVMRVRDVAPTSEQWRFGGAPAGVSNHTRVLDIVWPEAGEQEAWLSDFAPVDASQSQLEPADFAAVPMLGLEN